MPETLSPGIFITEVSSAVRAIRGVATSTVGFVGLAKKGPIGIPVFVSSEAEATRIFGGLSASAHLMYAVQAFFRSGGQRCYIVRTAHYTDIQSRASLTAVKATLNLKGVAEGVDVGQNAIGYLTAVAAGVGTSIEDGDVFDLTDYLGVTKTFEFDVAGGGVGVGNVAVALASASDAASLVKAAIILAINNAGFGLKAFSGAGQLIKLEQQGPGAAGNTAISQTLSNAATLTPVNFTGGAAEGGLLNVLRVDALSEGIWGNALNVGTRKAATTVSTLADSATATYLEVANAASLEAGDLIYVEGVGADDVRFVATKIDTVASPHRVYFKSTNLSLHQIPVGAVVYTGSVHKNKTILTADLADGVTFIDVANPATFTKGTILSIIDTVNHKSFTNIEVDRVSGKRVYFTAALNTSGVSILVADSLVVSQEFTLKVYQDNTLLETFENLSMSENNAVDYAPARINSVSQYITVTDLAAALTEGGQIPFGFEVGAGTDSFLTSGDDGLTGLADADYVGDPSAQTGLYAFDVITDVALLAVPGITSQVVHEGIVTYAEGRKDLFAVLDPPAAKSAQETVNYVKNVANFNTSYAAIYWPWVTISDPLTGKKLDRPPSGFVLGRYAYTDNNRTPGVAKAPAGIVDGKLQGIIGLETTPTQGDRDLLYPAKINPLADFPGDGRVIWGAQTLSSDANFRLIQVRRLFIFIRSSLITSMRFVVFENNDVDTRAAVRRSMGAFLLGLWRRRMLRGSKPEDAFFIVCDESNNPPSVIDQGRLIADAGVAPQKATEFFEINMAIDQRALQEELAAAGL